MNARVFFIVFFISLSGKAHPFCEKSTEGLHADLTRAVVRSSDWMKQFYAEKTTKLRPYRAASMFATLRIAGHYPSTLLTDFKDGQGNSIDETLKNKLNTVQNLSSIATPELGLIIQGVISICKDPKDFHGYNLIKPLLAGFPKYKTYSSFNNYFGYSLAVIALCNAGNKVPNFVIKELIKGANRKVSYHSVDIDALISTALSCVSTSNRSLQRKVDRAIGKLIESMISKQNTTTGAFGNQYTTALAVEALQAARIHTDGYSCDKAMRNILTYQDDEGSFGSILANIQITPALLGESLISLKRYACPVVPSPTPPPQIITVRVQLVFNVTDMRRTEPPVSVSVLEGTTAYSILVMAGKQNSCYTATYKKYSFGRSVTSICGVAKDSSKNYYWLIYVNEKSAKYGVDGLKPKDGDLITFKYEKLTFK
ncbi:gastric intrinsic factor-like [Paramuricea clavata]|uniref:Gastric intrinsic factor-like n=1 Tax=Paramuricea clavata TaxID=317549 RepID=A0A6S7J8T2_PARCT|nr:gastric intrinsic factor-like [Paramuricea clavata]